MNVRSMRLIDRWVGVPLCLLLTIARKVTDPFRHGARLPPRRILFVKLAEQGSTVLAHRAFSRAIEKVGRENVFFLVFEDNRFVMDAMALIPSDNIVTISTSSPLSAIRGALGAVRRLRREGIDVAIDFEFFARASAVLCYLSGAQARVGFHPFGGGAAWRGDLMTHRLSYNPHMHTSRSFAVMVEALDVDPAVLPALDVEAGGESAQSPQWRPRSADVQAVRETLLKEISGQDLPPMVLLNANCSDMLPLRRWPEERYVELARRLLTRYAELYVVFTGAPAEAEEVFALVNAVQSERCLSLAGKTTLGELLALYTLSDVLVTNDSGPAHFATLTPLHVVTLFGPETPTLYAARSERNHVFWAGLPCSPCVTAYNNRLSGCRNNICMQKISVDQVFQKVCWILDGRRSPGEPRKDKRSSTEGTASAASGRHGHAEAEGDCSRHGSSSTGTGREDSFG
jgi:ADP-heptose:LPS heptosyltransferase